MNVQTLYKPSDFRLLQASGEMFYRFEELSIEVQNTGSHAGRYDGTARITFWNDKEEGLSWFVHDIVLECDDGKHVKLEQSSRLYLSLWAQLTDGSLKDSVEAQVMEKL